MGHYAKTYIYMPLNLSMSASLSPSVHLKLYQFTYTWDSASLYLTTFQSVPFPPAPVGSLSRIFLLPHTDAHINLVLHCNDILMAIHTPPTPSQSISLSPASHNILGHDETSNGIPVSLSFVLGHIVVHGD